MAAFYRGISFAPGGAPDWASVTALFLPGARMTLPRMPGVEGVCSMEVDGWGERFRDDIGRTRIVAFEERELASRGFEFGDVAHLFSVFESRIATAAATQVLRGVYSVQLIRSDGRWLIAGMVWDFAGETRPLPAELLGGAP